MRLHALTEGFSSPTQGEFAYRPDDHPDDFIRVEPSRVSKRWLPADPVDSLSSFKGGKIYFALNLVPTQQFISKGVAANRTKLMYETALFAQRQRLDTTEALRKYAMELRVQRQRKDFHRSEEQAAELETEAKRLEQLAFLMQQEGIERVATIVTSIHQQAAAELQTHRNAFARAIKHPHNPQEQRLQSQVIRLALENLQRILPDPYDLVVFPASSSNFNLEFAVLVAEQLGARDLLQLEKVIEAPEIYYDELLLRATKVKGLADLNRRTRYRAIEHEGETYTPNDARWPQLWADKEARKLHKQAERGGNQIKHNTMMDKRRYAQLFKAPQEELAGLKVLLVDDNVHYSGTMELCHRLLKERTPERLDVFTPFYMGDEVGGQEPIKRPVQRQSAQKSLIPV